jgi:hypothetical protein
VFIAISRKGFVMGEKEGQDQSSTDMETVGIETKGGGGYGIKAEVGMELCYLHGQT